MTEAAILAIIQALTQALPGVFDVVQGFEAINGPSDVLRASLATLMAANDANFMATEARLIAADTAT